MSSKRGRNLIIIVTLCAMFSLTACSLMDVLGNLMDGNEDDLTEILSATLTAMAKEKDEPTVEPQNPTGTLTGQLTYPSFRLPALRVVAFDVNDLSRYFITESTAEELYSLQVSPGTYYVLAYLVDPAELGADPGVKGGYSQAVLCGLGDGCDDHSLVSVTLNAGDTLTNINPADWLLPGEGQEGWPQDPTVIGTGVIKGNLGYPSEFIPELRVVAFNIHNEDYHFIETEHNQQTYEMRDLPPGTYHVVAYVLNMGMDMPLAYSQFVLCGSTVDCTDHTLVEVNVYADHVTEGIDPIDAYITAEEAGWPEDPTQ